MADTKHEAGQGTPNPAATDTTTPVPPAPAAGAEGTAPKPADQAGADAAGAQGQPAAGDGKPALPERYDLKVPEGSEAFVDQDDLTAWADKAKTEGWTQAEAVEHLEAFADQMAGLRKRLYEETVADPTYGGKNLEASQAAAKRFIARVRPADHPMTERWNKWLEKTGAGNALDWFAFLADAAKLIAEDAPGSRSGAPPRSDKPAEEVLYGNG